MVYKAEDTKLKRAVALTLLAAHLLNPGFHQHVHYWWLTVLANAVHPLTGLAPSSLQ